MAAVDQLDAELDEVLGSIDLEVLCAMVDNVTLMGDSVAKTGSDVAFAGSRQFWRVVAACATKRLNDELVRRHDAESEAPDVD